MPVTTFLRSTVPAALKKKKLFAVYLTSIFDVLSPLAAPKPQKTGDLVAGYSDQMDEEGPTKTHTDNTT